MKTALRLLSIFFISSILISSGCKKGGGGGGGGGTNEANLAVTLNPPNGSVQAPANGPNFDLTVTITSTMPPNGVKIEITAKKDDGTNPPPFFTSTNNTTTSVNNYVITNTPATTACVVDVKVTSLTKPTNTWTGQYRYSRK
jgi:hypothetical protein